jgi:hypothetical protein
VRDQQMMRLAAGFEGKCGCQPTVECKTAGTALFLAPPLVAAQFEASRSTFSARMRIKLWM